MLSDIHILAGATAIMRTQSHLCLLFLVFACGAAYAESDEISRSEALLPTGPKAATMPKLGAPESPSQIRVHGTAWVADCMRDWEPSTHMTKKEWENTCRRVVQERVKFLLDQAK
jgi:hypothetical protein